jgi:hypothetical protein
MAKVFGGLRRHLLENGNCGVQRHKVEGGVASPGSRRVEDHGGAEFQGHPRGGGVTRGDGKIEEHLDSGSLRLHWLPRPHKRSRDNAPCRP